jgi:hypothetical protein
MKEIQSISNLKIEKKKAWNKPVLVSGKEFGFFGMPMAYTGPGSSKSGS